MKSTLTILLTFLVSGAFAQQYSQVLSEVHLWNGSEITKDGTHQTRLLTEGSTVDMECFEMYGTTLLPGNDPPALHVNDEMEQMIIVKEGELKIAIGEASKIMGPGSLAVIMPGDERGVANLSDKPVTYIVLNMRSRKAPDLRRGQEAGGSFMMDFEDIEFSPHGRGGIRNYFNRPTTMCTKFDIHVTNLNEGIKSHEPHTHRAAELVLMISGDSEMEIGGKFYQSSAGGDVYFLGSNVPHAIENIGDESAMYYAIQFQ